MFKLILKRRGPVLNIFEYHVGERQIINVNVLSRLFHRGDDYAINNALREFRIKKPPLINNVNLNRKYSSLPEPLEDNQPRTIFVGYEDLYAHSILENRETYSPTLAENLTDFNNDNNNIEITKNELENYINQSWKSLPVPDIIEAFKKISYYALKNNESIVDEKYEKFLKYLIANSGKFTDSEIHDLLISISLWPVFHTRNDQIFRNLYTALDAECIRRAPEWTVNDLLKMADHWYVARLFRHTELADCVVRKLGSKPNRMTPSNLVQYMFYVNVARKHPREMYNLEYRMESCADQLDLDELAVLAMGFFKSQTPIRNYNLLVKITQRVIKDIDHIHEISLSAFMKIVRYSSTMQNECAILWELIVSTIPQIPRLSLKALVHIVSTTVKMRVFHPELLTAVAGRFNQEMKDARLKDMERLVLALTCFNFTPDIQPNIYQTIVEELNSPDRRPDLERYQRSLANLLQYLSVMNLYPKDLLAFTLDPENLRNTYGVSPFTYNHAILVLDLNIEAEVPDYTGPRLTHRSRSIIAKGYVNKIPVPSERGLSARHQFLIGILDTCKEIFGSTEMLHIDWVLPNYKEADVIICLDKNNSPLPVKPLLSEIPFGEVKRRPEITPEESRWFAIVIGAQNCYIRNTSELLGKDFVKIRQLERIGYKPIMIPWFEWSTNDGDRKNYLKEKLFE